MSYFIVEKMNSGMIELFDRWPEQTLKMSMEIHNELESKGDATTS